MTEHWAAERARPEVHVAAHLQALTEAAKRRGDAGATPVKLSKLSKLLQIFNDYKPPGEKEEEEAAANNDDDDIDLNFDNPFKAAFSKKHSKAVS